MKRILTDRDHFQYICAAVMLFSGVLLSFLGFFEEPTGEISNSVLWYFAQCLIWAGSVFGLTSYVDWKLRKFKESSNSPD